MGQNITMLTGIVAGVIPLQNDLYLITVSPWDLALVRSDIMDVQMFFFSYFVLLGGLLPLFLRASWLEQYDWTQNRKSVHHEKLSSAEGSWG